MTRQELIDFTKEHDVGIFSFTNVNRIPERDLERMERNFGAKAKNKRYGLYYGYSDDDINFCVVDIQDVHKLEERLISWGINFDVPNVTFIKKGSNEAAIISMKVKDDIKCPVSVVFNCFEDNEIAQLPSPYGFFGNWGCYAVSQRHWKELNTQNYFRSDDEEV
jgi:hypothetical protein